MKAFFYCAINGLASLSLMKVFLFFFFFVFIDIFEHVQQWCIKRVKMKTTDDDDGNYMFQFLLFISHSFTHSPRLDLMDFSSMKLKEKLNNYAIYSLVIDRQWVSLWISCMRAHVKMFWLSSSMDVWWRKIGSIKLSNQTKKPFHYWNVQKNAVMSTDSLHNWIWWPREGLHCLSRSFLSIKSSECLLFFTLLRLSFFAKNFNVNLPLKVSKKVLKGGDERLKFLLHVSMTNLCCMWRTRFYFLSHSLILQFDCTNCMPKMWSELIKSRLIYSVSSCLLFFWESFSWKLSLASRCSVNEQWNCLKRPSREIFLLS